MNHSVLNSDVQEFIDSHLQTDIASIVFKGSPFDSVSIQELVTQIESKQKCQNKLPTWYATKNIYFPNKLHIEQTSSEITARYKSQLINGKKLIDITGGFGVDAYYFAKQFDHVTHCEINPELYAIATHNFKVLDQETIDSISVDGIDYLRDSEHRYDWIYADPSRRHDSKGKVFFLNDCQPNIPKHLDQLFQHTKNIMIKTSPMLDITMGMSELKHVKHVHIVAVNNEVKELLWLLEKDYHSTIEITAVDLNQQEASIFTYDFDSEKDVAPTYAEPANYVYEPHAAIMKSGAFNSVSHQLQIAKLHKHSHLYTHTDLIDFPGRSFKIKLVIPFNKSEVKRLGLKKANITTRNFPMTVAQIRKKFQLSDGGDVYLFFTTNNHDEKIMIWCEKI